MSHIRCGCEDGYDCTKTTVCAIQSAIEDKEAEIDALRPVAEAAVEWCQAVQFAHHNPTKKGYLKAVLARLNTEVEEFTVWEMG